MFLLKSNQTCFILDNRKGYTYWPAGRMIPHTQVTFWEGLGDHANLQRSELGSLLVWDGGNEHAYDCLHA